MKKLLVLLVAVFVAAGCGGVRSRVVQPNLQANAQPHSERVCMLQGYPTNEHKFVHLGRIRAAKGSYGSALELWHSMATEGRKLGADAIVGIQSGQRFGGPLPWRVTRPVGDGLAIKFLPDSPRFDCHATGGQLF